LVQGGRQHDNGKVFLPEDLLKKSTVLFIVIMNVGMVQDTRAD
jgi:hypothetical protein